MMLFAVCAILALASPGLAADSSQEKLVNNKTMLAEIQDCMDKTNLTKEQYEHFCLIGTEPDQEPAASEFQAATFCVYNVTGTIKDGKVYPEKFLAVTPKEEEKGVLKILNETYVGDAHNDYQIALILHHALIKKTDDKAYEKNCKKVVKLYYPD